MSEPLLIAHRGLTGAAAPENSAAAFRAAVRAGLEAVELDVRPTADGQLVVLHDETFARVAGCAVAASRTSIDRVARLRFLDAPSEGPILLEDALALLGGARVVDIEVKPDPGAGAVDLATRLDAVLDDTGARARIVVTSESPEILGAVGGHRPRLTLGLVFRSGDVAHALDRARAVGARVIVANEGRVDVRLATRLHREGFAMWSYTVNDPARARELIGLGVAGLISDDPPALRAALAETDAPAGPGHDPAWTAVKAR